MTPASLSRMGSQLLAVALTVTVAGLSAGFDDEFHNVRWFYEAQARGGSLMDFVSLANVDPVHPAGSYLIDFALMWVLKSWELVRIAKSLLVLGLMYLSLRRLFPELKGGRVDWWLVAAVTPAFLMWGTGLRWFGEFSAVYLMAVALAGFIPRRSAWFFPALALLLGALAHLNYLALIMAPPVVLFHLFGAWRERALRTVPVVLAALVGVVAVAPVLLDILRAPRDGQTAGLVGSAIGTINGLLVNPGVFPLSVEGLLTLAATTLFFAVGAVRGGGRRVLDPLLVMIALTLVLIVVSGLGSKYRNVMPLLPLVLGYSFVSLRVPVPEARRVLRLASTVALAGMVATNAYGAVAVALHRNTAKGSWNLPVAETIATLEAAASSCQHPMVLLWDPVLEYHLWRAGLDTGYLSVKRGDSELENSVYPLSLETVDCLFMLETTQGAYEGAPYFSGNGLQKTRIAELGADSNAAFKERLQPNTPAFSVVLYRLAEGQSEDVRAYFSQSFYGKLPG